MYVRATYIENDVWVLELFGWYWSAARRQAPADVRQLLQISRTLYEDLPRGPSGSAPVRVKTEEEEEAAHLRQREEDEREISQREHARQKRTPRWREKSCVMLGRNWLRMRQHTRPGRAGRAAAASGDLLCVVFA